MTNTQTTTSIGSLPHIEMTLDPITGAFQASSPTSHHLAPQPSCAVCGSHEVMRYTFVAFDTAHRQWRAVNGAGRAVCKVCDDVTALLFISEGSNQ